MGRGPKMPKLPLSMKTSLDTVAKRTGFNNLPVHTSQIERDLPQSKVKARRNILAIFKTWTPYCAKFVGFMLKPSHKQLMYRKNKWNVNIRLYAGALEGSTVVPEMSSAARGASDSPWDGTISFEEALSSAGKHGPDIGQSECARECKKFKD